MGRHRGKLHLTVCLQFAFQADNEAYGEPARGLKETNDTKR